MKDPLIDAFRRLVQGDPAAGAPPRADNYTPEEIRNFSAADRARWLGTLPGRPSVSPESTSSSLIAALRKVLSQNMGRTGFFPSWGVPKGAEGPADEMPLPEIPCTTPEDKLTCEECGSEILNGAETCTYCSRV